MRWLESRHGFRDRSVQLAVHFGDVQFTRPLRHDQRGDAVATLTVLEAARRCAAEGRPVNLPLPEENSS